MTPPPTADAVLAVGGGIDNNDNNPNIGDQLDPNAQVDNNPQQIGGLAHPADPAPSSSDSDSDMAREKAASGISIADFNSNKDDFDEWIELFEASVELATNPQTNDRKHALFLKWLTIKLDPPARAVLKQITPGTAYATAGGVKGVKDQLSELLIDEHEVYKWQAHKLKLTWDQKESFQELATRVKRAVDKYEKDLDATSREKAYFFRFREALPKQYRNCIDVSCVKTERTLENAKEIALRVQLTQDEDADLTGAAMADDRIHGLELKVAELGTKMDNLSLSQKGEEPKERKTSREGRFLKNRSTPTQRESSSSTERNYREYKQFRNWQDCDKNRDRCDRGHRDSSRDSSRDDRRRRDNGRDRDRSGKDRRCSGRNDDRKDRDRSDRRDRQASDSSSNSESN